MPVAFSQPVPGEILDFAAAVRFAGVAPAGVASVALIAIDVDPPVAFAVAPVAGGVWAATRKFSGPGVRHIEARGLDGGGAPVAGAVAIVTFTLHVSQLAGYQPPLATLPHLGKITHLLEVSDRVANGFVDSRAVFALPGGQVYIDSNLDLDTDGSRFAAQDATGQNDTSLHTAGGKPVDSETVPYFVLPPAFAHAHGMRLGDLAAVLSRDRIAFAVLADYGPPDKIGEGSIALHRALGHETILRGRLHDSDIPRDVLTVTFPGSGTGHLPTSDTIATNGKALFVALGGVV